MIDRLPSSYFYNTGCFIISDSVCHVMFTLPPPHKHILRIHLKPIFDHFSRYLRLRKYRLNIAVAMKHAGAVKPLIELHCVTIFKWCVLGIRVNFKRSFAVYIELFTCRGVPIDVISQVCSCAGVSPSHYTTQSD